MYTHKAVKRLLDSIWTIEYNLLVDDEIFVLKYSRNDVEGYEQEKTLPKLHTVENSEGRILESVIIDNVLKQVSNPQFIFSYGA